MSELRLHAITSRDEALSLAERIQGCAEESMREFRDSPLPADVGRRLIERGFDTPEFLLLVAREGEDVRGICLTAPFTDPLTGEVTPMIVVLHVDSSFRHRGLARALASEARRLLARRGLTRVAARAGYNDDALISMGERWGYLRSWELLLHEA